MRTLHDRRQHGSLRSDSSYAPSVFFLFFVFFGLRGSGRGRLELAEAILKHSKQDSQGSGQDPGVQWSLPCRYGCVILEGALFSLSIGGVPLF